MLELAFLLLLIFFVYLLFQIVRMFIWIRPVKMNFKPANHSYDTIGPLLLAGTVFFWFYDQNIAILLTVVFILFAMINTELH